MQHCSPVVEFCHVIGRNVRLLSLVTSSTNFLENMM